MAYPEKKRSSYKKRGVAIVVLVCLFSTTGCATANRYPSSARKTSVVKSTQVNQPIEGVENSVKNAYGSEDKTEKIPEIPYRVYDRTYYPLKRVQNFSAEGIASWYGLDFHGQRTSNKEVYNMNSMTAAHKTLPFNTQVKVLNLDNGLEAIVRINDRGPFVSDRIIDLSQQAAKTLGMIQKGTARVRLTVLDQSGDPTSGSAARAIAPESYSVQIGVFKDLANADRLKQQFDNSRTEQYDQRGGRHYRVLVGNYPDFEEALKRLDDLRTNGYPRAFIVAGK